ncbi:MAG TPA: hypothetical protein VK986_20225 [Tepidisphaeraceae bacterium]|nr:hypothetical protein [Tepidisphaeraceae bacterium]
MKLLVTRLVLALGVAGPALGADPKSEYVPKLGEFPPADVGVYHAGELVTVDAINRKGTLRIIGNRDLEKYHSSEAQPFVLLPYARVRYRGAPAELRDIPIGTVLHAYCVYPPNYSKEGKRPALGAYVQPQDHAVSLEDSFSFYQRRGQAWKIESIEPGKLNVVSTGPAEGDGPLGRQMFNFDDSTRVWKGKEIGGVADLAAGQTVQFNFTWAVDWGMGRMHVTDVWVDDLSRSTAAELQRQIHIRYLRYHWLPGWVEHVEDQGGGKGILTVALFAGSDASLLERVKAASQIHIAVAEPTLRTYMHAYDSKGGPLLEVKATPKPPFGHSGLTVRVQVDELLEGYRPGRVVRIRPNDFPAAKLPPEERIRN